MAAERSVDVPETEGIATARAAERPALGGPTTNTAVYLGLTTSLVSYLIAALYNIRLSVCNIRSSADFWKNRAVAGPRRYGFKAVA